MIAAHELDIAPLLPGQFNYTVNETGRTPVSVGVIYNERGQVLTFDQHTSQGGKVALSGVFPEATLFDTPTAERAKQVIPERFGWKLVDAKLAKIAVLPLTKHTSSRLLVPVRYSADSSIVDTDAHLSFLPNSVPVWRTPGDVFSLMRRLDDTDGAKGLQRRSITKMVLDACK